MEVPAPRSADRRGSQAPTLWFDVGDFLEFFRYLERPTGIQRVEMEIFAQLAQSRWPRGAIRFCRLDRHVDRFESVALETLDMVFHDLPSASVISDTKVHNPLGYGLRVGWERLSLWRFRLVRSLRRTLRGKQISYWHPAPAGPRADSFRRGDILTCLGTSWENPRYVGFLERARRELGVPVTVLIYDIIPVTYPQWVTADLVEKFEHWLGGVLSNADLVLTISEHSRAALLRLAADRRMALPPVEILRLGTGFRAIDRAPGPRADLGLPARFVLYVSTIEIRKNHALLLRIWRGLIAKHGAADVPDLVFVGRQGWFVDDLMAELSAAGPLRGKVVIRTGLSDAEVATAYRRCLFTVFPSLMEGWGLPVSESLELGKLCIASNRGALPEVGGDLVDYFDPDDDAGALAAIERAIFDDDYRRAREARIRAVFRPRSWAESTAALIARLDRLYVETGLRSAGAAPSVSGPEADRRRESQGVADVV
jgi:glycosyltransferase involved in cell wall biosynthesis